MTEPLLLLGYQSPRMGVAVYRGGGTWHVPHLHEGISLTATPPLAKVVPLDYDGFEWNWPEAPACSA
ncbi:MAG: hypothetical protein OEW52_12005 [Thermoleophilia bacterium]|nr:hypothetical protein [Thermoleophilia bacterium]MDH4341376.1 hypothetical protein [Thermoleophilia bacterium]MDH5281849.1 hypothetical protein [Thermoleophilia bacterium]